MKDHLKAERLAYRPTRELSQLLQKERRDFTRDDLVSVVEKESVPMINFRFVAGDGRLKTFNFVVRDKKQLDRLLSAGERVDGSNLFALVDPGASDLYVLPRYSTAYLNPFSTLPTLDVLCTFFAPDGEPFASSPDGIVRRAHQILRGATGLSMETLTELEYYVSAQPESLFRGEAQKGYAEASPFSRWQELRLEAMYHLAQMGMPVKYGHSEVGKVSDENSGLEQAEIEFDLAPVEQAADAVVLARWVLRMLGARYGVTVTFAPKLVHGHAGSGLHVHARLVQEDRNAIGDADGLNEEALKLISGFLDLAPSLTAFGNTIPISYLRLVPDQEAPVHICWGDRNRSALVRVPLSWCKVADMAQTANPNDEGAHTRKAHNHTLEFRSPDGSADIHLLNAGLTVAARHGLAMENAVELARNLRVDDNVFKPELDEKRRTLPRLPTSCGESARALLDHRAIYEEFGIFSPQVIDRVANQLRSYAEEEERCRTAGFEELNKLIAKYLHCS